MQDYAVRKATTGAYVAQLTAPDGVTPIPRPMVGFALTISLYTTLPDGRIAVVNGRDQQNALNANNVTVDPAGRIVWTFQPADTTPFFLSAMWVKHVVRFVGTWSNGTYLHEAALNIRNLTQVPPLAGIFDPVYFDALVYQT